MTESPREVVLQVENLDLSFGATRALTGVSLEVRKGEILALIGPNGAGKTCMINCITGFYRPKAGSIRFGNREITRMAPHRIAELGIARTFQNIELFSGMSTLDNLMAARHMHLRSGILEQALYFGPAHRKEIEHRKRVEEIIDFLEIESIRKSTVATLSYGLRKRIDLGRALAMNPKLLLLDEPMAGLNVEEKEDLARFIVDIFEETQIPIVFIEHDMGVVMDIADRIVVFNFGYKIAEGIPEEISVNPEVTKAYLGEG